MSSLKLLGNFRKQAENAGKIGPGGVCRPLRGPLGNHDRNYRIKKQDER